MPIEWTDWTPAAKAILTVACLTGFWIWETLAPFDQGRRHRWRHAGRNACIAILNTVVLNALFGAATVGMAQWAGDHQFGLLRVFDIPWPWRLVAAIILLDGWLYVWHRLNHRIPLLWRFHRMHHSDREMDVTTATRFHLGEHFGSATLRLIIIPLIGVTAAEILVYETLVVTLTMFHHANISLGAFDRPLRWLVVTPRMHQIHHSRRRSETNSNYSVLFSLWDRLGLTYRMRTGFEKIELGLENMIEDRWQTVTGMLKTPIARLDACHQESAAEESCAAL